MDGDGRGRVVVVVEVVVGGRVGGGGSNQERQRQRERGSGQSGRNVKFCGELGQSAWGMSSITAKLAKSEPQKGYGEGLEGEKGERPRYLGSQSRWK